MRHYLTGSLLVVSVCGIIRAAVGEIPPEPREKADYVVTGVVEGVYARDQGHYHNYVVELRLDSVEKGKQLKAGTTLYVSCFRRKASAPQEPSAGGHKPPPKEGQRIKAYVKDGKGKHPAIYSNWYDELTTAHQ
jgi:hypothetical protein